MTLKYNVIRSKRDFSSQHAALSAGMRNVHFIHEITLGRMVGSLVEREMYGKFILITSSSRKYVKSMSNQ